MISDLSKLAQLPNASARISTQSGSRADEVNYSCYQIAHTCTSAHMCTCVRTRTPTSANSACECSFPLQLQILSSFSLLPMQQVSSGHLWSIGPGLTPVLIWVKSSTRGTIPRSYLVNCRREGGGLLPPAHPWEFLPLQKKARPSEPCARNNRSFIHWD